MATKLSTIEYIVDQLVSVPNISTRKMFGEYALYCGKKVVALVCEDTLFVKITEKGKKFLGEYYKEGVAYKGAKPSIQIDEEVLENREMISKLILITEEGVVEVKRKRRKA